MSASKLISIDDSANKNQDIGFKSSEIFIQDIVLNELKSDYKRLSLKKEYEVIFTNLFFNHKSLN
jgi:hypothetical protein